MYCEFLYCSTNEDKIIFRRTQNFDWTIARVVYKLGSPIILQFKPFHRDNELQTIHISSPT